MYFIKLRQFIVKNQKLIYQAIENKMDLKKFNGKKRKIMVKNNYFNNYFFRYESIYFFVIDGRIY